MNYNCVYIYIYYSGTLHRSSVLKSIFSPQPSRHGCRQQRACHAHKNAHKYRLVPNYFKRTKACGASGKRSPECKEHRWFDMFLDHHLHPLETCLLVVGASSDWGMLLEQPTWSRDQDRSACDIVALRHSGSIEQLKLDIFLPVVPHKAVAEVSE